MTRKSRKRPSKELHARREELRAHEELNTLWEVLATTKQPNWLDVPWRDGRNAVRLILRMIKATAAPDQSTKLDAIELLRRWSHGERLETTEPYWAAQECLEEIGYTSITERMLVLIRSGLRMMQLCISNSHGGGLAYNHILFGHGINWASKEIESERCRDALGIDPTYDGSPRDKLRRAFYMAWERGLYDIAYAVGKANL